MAEKKGAKEKVAARAKAKKKKAEHILTTGKRKKAVARAKIKAGKGKVLINSTPLDLWGTNILRLWIKEPLLLSEEIAKSIDIDVNVHSGGIVAQAEAIRLAIARGMLEFSKDKNLKKKFLDFGRNLLVYDPRRTEPHHGHGASKRGARRHKQRSKR